jgi:hypothetical protein
MHETISSDGKVFGRISNYAYQPQKLGHAVRRRMVQPNVRHIRDGTSAESHDNLWSHGGTEFG